MGSAWITALASLTGTIVGALVTLAGQHFQARRARGAQVDDQRRAAVTTLLARKDVLVAEYEGLWQQIGRNRKSTVASEAFLRCYQAWSAYQDVRAPVRAAGDAKIDAAGTALRKAIENLVNTVDWAYYGWGENPESLDEWFQPIHDADRAVIAALNDRQPTPAAL
jgi:hypothetical protein